jgi:crossover junction endodeoxyribonuclease RusA
VIVVSFADPAPRLNMNDRGHWRAFARHKANWRHAAKIHGRNLQLPAIDHPVNVRVVFGVRDPGRRRDPHNMAPTVKAVVDGLVDARLLVDDDSAHVTIIDPVFVKGPGVRIEITPREATR